MIKLRVLGLIVIMLLFGCDDTVTQNANNDFHGIVHFKHSDHSLNEFSTTDETWMKIGIYKIEANVADGPTWDVYEKEFRDNITLPFTYNFSEISSNMFDFDTYQYFLYCRVYMGEEEGTFVGDLTSEVRTEITDLNASNDIDVFGIEECGSDISGGWCSTQFRD